MGARFGRNKRRAAREAVAYAQAEARAASTKATLAHQAAARGLAAARAATDLLDELEARLRRSIDPDTALTVRPRYRMVQEFTDYPVAVPRMPMEFSLDNELDPALRRIDLLSLVIAVERMPLERSATRLHMFERHRRTGEIAYVFTDEQLDHAPSSAVVRGMAESVVHRMFEAMRTARQGGGGDEFGRARQADLRRKAGGPAR